MSRLIALLLGALVAGGAAADSGSKSFGEHVVYYAAFPTTDLTAEIARSYGITRAGDRALVLVNVQKGGVMTAATVSGRARNLLGHEQPLSFREVRQQNTIDYLAELPVKDGALLIFDITVQSPEVSTPLQLQFQKNFYTND